MAQITHASSGESGHSVKGGNAGDQTGKEVYTKSWYDGNWEEMLHHPDDNVRKKASEIAVKLAASNLVGYDQGQRTTLYSELKKCNWDVDVYIKSGVKTETDCSAFCTTCYACVIEGLRHETYLPTTATISSLFTKHGFKLYTVSGGYNLKDDKNLTVGDLINRPSTASKGGHVAMITTSDGVILPDAVPTDASYSGDSNMGGSGSGSGSGQKYREIMPSRGSNIVYQLATPKTEKNNVLKQSDDRKNKFKEMISNMCNSAPELGRKIIQTSEMYEPSILKNGQSTKRERT